ncbi:DUF5647 family protein [Baaleninema simplex]|uniref:DUF5647 family protein n=1 Tax=Baaleninema simplex TaxID=2862350 RepID=UPI000344998E|nr:DUF5647 family protein [Baaleninema simplex]
MNTTNFNLDEIEETRDEQLLANAKAAGQFIDYLLENPESLDKIPNGSYVILETGNSEFDEENLRLKTRLEKQNETTLWTSEIVE